jgi:hypothetical protein
MDYYKKLFKYNNLKINDICDINKKNINETNINETNINETNINETNINETNINDINETTNSNIQNIDINDINYIKDNHFIEKFNTNVTIIDRIKIYKLLNDIRCDDIYLLSNTMNRKLERLLNDNFIIKNKINTLSDEIKKENNNKILYLTCITINITLLFFIVKKSK